VYVPGKLVTAFNWAYPKLITPKAVGAVTPLSS
jgi:hypothetical protein